MVIQQHDSVESEVFHLILPGSQHAETEKKNIKTCLYHPAEIVKNTVCGKTCFSL